MPVMDIEQAVKRRLMIVDALQQLMQRDVDYGKIPGGERETLLQPGADKLCNLFGITIQYEVVRRIEDWTGEQHGGEPFFFYEVKGRAHRGEFLMGEGTGSCNSWEKKYRWRQGSRVCPNCGKDIILKSKTAGEGWFCWGKRGGCGAKFAPGDNSVESQEVGRVKNPDVAEIVNTVLKMAHKRAKIAAAINATSASEFFTQDVEDFTGDDEKPPFNPPSAPRAESKPPAAPVLRLCPWGSMKECVHKFRAVCSTIHELDIQAELERHGWKSWEDLKKRIEAKPDHHKDVQIAIEIYENLCRLSGKVV